MTWAWGMTADTWRGPPLMALIAPPEGVSRSHGAMTERVRFQHASLLVTICTTAAHRHLYASCPASLQGHTVPRRAHPIAS